MKKSTILIIYVNIAILLLFWIGIAFTNWTIHVMTQLSTWQSGSRGYLFFVIFTLSLTFSAIIWIEQDNINKPKINK